MDQWRLFAKLVRERNPKAIAVNISADHNFADGLTVGEWEQMKAALGPDLEGRVVRNPRLAIDYLALRVPSMAPVYRRLQAIVHEVISAAFSNLVITPGVTTSEDVVWWMRQRVNDMGLGTWFQPSIEVQRMGVDGGRPRRQPGHPARRRAALRLRHHRDGPQHRHAAHGLRAAGWRDRCAGRADEGAHAREPAAGHPAGEDRAREDAAIRCCAKCWAR